MSVSSYMEKQAATKVAPQRLAIDWGTVFWAFLAGGIVTVLMVYGVIPAMFGYAVRYIEKK